MTPNFGRDLKKLIEQKHNKYSWLIESNITINKSENYKLLLMKNT